MRKRLNVMVCVVIFALLFGTLYSCSGKKTTTTGKTTGTSPTVKTTVKASGTVKTTTRPTGTQQTTGADSGSDQIADGETGDGEIPGEEPGGSSEPSEFLSYDFGGRTIYIDLIAGNPGKDLITDFDDRTFIRYNADGVYIKGSSKYLDLRYDHWRDVEQKMNCKIRVKWHGNPAITGWVNGPKRMMQDILSGTYQYDLCWPHNTLANFTKNNLVIPLDDYIDIDSIEKLRDPVVRALGTMRGKLYIVSEDVPDYGFAPKIGIQLQSIQYNPVIRDRDGLPDLFELFKTGSWTWDKLTEIALEATRDFNGDGVTDQWGACYNDPNVLAACVSHSNGMPLIEEVNGRLVHNLATPEFMRAMTIVSDLINVYKVLAPGQNYYTKGTSYMYLGGQFSTHTLIFYRDGKIKSRFVPLPIGPDNDEAKIVPELNKFGYCMPATEKDPNGIARLMVNLFWTMTDPGRPQLTYNEKIESARVYFDSFFWPDASNDLADLLDFWIDGIDGTKYISPSKADIWLNGYGTLQSVMGTDIFSQLQKATPVSQAIYSAIPKIEGILNEFN